MRIKINNNEYYELTQQEIDIQDLLKKLNAIANFTNFNTAVRNNPIPIQTERKKYVKSGKFTNEAKGIGIGHGKRINTRTWCDTREKSVELMKLSYHGTNEEKQKKAQELGVAWNEIVKSFYGLKKRYNIIPQDVGLERFPTRGESYVNFGKLKADKIKTDITSSEVQYI